MAKNDTYHNCTKGPVQLAFFYYALVVWILSACSHDEFTSGRLLHLSGNTMGTTYSIKVVVPPSESIDETLLTEALDRSLKDFNMTMSTYIGNSEISRLNRKPEGEWIAVSPALFEVLQLSEKMSRLTNGAFDVTVGPLVNAWGFGPDKSEGIPTREQIAKIKHSIGYQNISLRGETQEIQKTRPVFIDLSAIAKGYATDVIGTFLETRRLENYMVEIGGELKIRGVNQHNQNWRIGIEKPALGRKGAIQAVTGNNIAIATSGDYRNYYEESGMRKSHLIDPVAGEPISHKLASVTVVAEQGGFADALATALNVLGPDVGYQLAHNEGLAAFFIIREKDAYRVKYTDAFERYMVNQ